MRYTRPTGYMRRLLGNSLSMKKTVKWGAIVSAAFLATLLFVRLPFGTPLRAEIYEYRGALFIGALGVLFVLVANKLFKNS